MIAAGALGLVAGLGAVGVVVALRSRPMPLDAVVAAMNAPVPLAPRGSAMALDRMGRSLGGWLEEQPFTVGPRWAVARQHLAITGTTVDRLATRVVVGAGAGLLAPALLWLAVAATGTLLPAAWVLVLTVLLAPAAGAVPVVRLRASARARRRHFRVVVGSFTDLVVLEL
ncbi:MAG TPA: hypothetical protein VE991_08980, partial [Acidimicrobiales bacterium]|nr:hypothetical protein [Acidimicrobiales bacterium]